MDKGFLKYEKLLHRRKFCEDQMGEILEGRLHMVGKDGKLAEGKVQNKKDLFLYRYYEYHYDKCDRLLKLIDKYDESNIDPD